MNRSELVPDSVVALIENKSAAEYHGTSPFISVLAISRKGERNNLGLVGGKIEETDGSPLIALCREVLEEVGLIVHDAEFIYERVDPASDSVAWCYRIKKWAGEPKAVEPNTWVSWESPARLLREDCIFREYNRGLFRHIGYQID